MRFVFNPLSKEFDIVPSVVGPGGVTWVVVSGTSQQMVANEGYIVTNVALTTLTLPTTADVGTLVWVVGYGSGGWSIDQSANQIIHFGNRDTANGVAGSISSTNRYDAIQLICTVANLEWNATGAVQGNLTIV